MPVFHTTLAGVVLQIRARAERPLARAGQHDTAYVRCGLNLVPNFAKPLVRGRIDGIHPIRPVNRDAGNMTLDVERDAHSAALVRKRAAKS